MYFKGKLNYSHKKLALTISILFSLVIIVIAEIITVMSLSLWFPATLVTTFLICSAELLYSERHGSAVISNDATELMIEQVFLFGLIKIRRHYVITDEFRDFLQNVVDQNIEKFDIPQFNKSHNFDITFFNIHLPQ